MPKTLNRYNRRRKTKTQRRHKHRGGIKYQSLSHYPGQIYKFDKASNNLDALDSLLRDSKIPVLVRHHRKSCPHCEDFEKPWNAIETSAKGHPDFSVASLDDWATDHMHKHHYSSHGYSVSGVPTVVMIDRNRVPNEHTGPNTVEALEEFLKRHGMQIKIVPIEGQEQDQPEQDQQEQDQPEQDQQEQDQPEQQETESQYAQSDSAVASSEPQPLEESQSQPQSQPQESGSLIDRMREKIGSIDESIGNGVENVKSALTEPINFGGLFATSDATKNNNNVNTTANAFPDVPLAAAPAPAAAAHSTASPSLSDNNNQIIGAPQVPSIAGGKKHRKGKKSKKKSKHSSKRRSKRRSNK